jgi:uncharacterized protein YycO
MKKRRHVFLIIVVLTSIIFLTNFCFRNEAINYKKSEKIEFKTGDIIFQTSMSSQSKAIQIATNSIYSHCGIIYIENDKKFVIEAGDPVCKTNLNEFIKRGKNGHYVVKRLSNANEIFTKKAISKLTIEVNNILGKKYDYAFNWSDERYYCSELVWKLYKRITNIEVGKLKKLRDFNLNNKTVIDKLNKRYSTNIPLDENIISPEAIFNHNQLIEIYSN